MTVAANMSNKNRPAQKSPSLPASEPLDPETEERIARLVVEYEQRVRAELTKTNRTLRNIEMDVEDLGNAVKESITKEIIDQASPGYVGTRSLCACGARAKYSKMSLRQIITLHGSQAFKRAYYHCKSCRTGFCPTDRVLEIGASECSPSVQAHIARVSGYLPFGKAARDLAEARGLIVSSSTVQRYAKKVGARIGDAWETNRVQQMCGNLPPPNIIPARMFASMDGVKVHVDGGWHDAKLGVVYQRDDAGKVNHACFYGSFEHSHQFGRRMRVLADVNGARQCDDLQMLGDGGEWIWIETRKHFPHCIETLDNYHLTDHVWEVAHSRFGQDSEPAKAWMVEQKKCLLTDKATEVIKNIASWTPSGTAKTELRRKTICYMQTHRDRTCYETFKTAGYDIGSGIMESGCKTVVKARMGGAGMRWSQAGANAILHLSAHRHSTGRTNYVEFTVK